MSYTIGNTPIIVDVTGYNAPISVAVTLGTGASLTVKTTNKINPTASDWVLWDYGVITVSGTYLIGSRVGALQLTNSSGVNTSTITVTEYSDTGVSSDTAISAGSVPRELRDILSDVATVKDYGAVGDGVTDDSGAFSKMLSIKGYIRLRPNDTYLISNSVSVTDGHMIVFGNGAKIIQNCDAPVFKQYVTYTNEQAISSITHTSIDMGSGTTTSTDKLAITSGSAYSVDDVVRVISNDLGDWADPANTERIGEFAHVQSISTNDVYLRNGLIEAYSTSPRIWKMNKAYRCFIKDVNFTCTLGLAASYNAPVMWISGVYQPQILDYTIDYSYSEGIRLDGCYGAITRGSANNLQTSAGDFRYGYGIVSYSCAFGRHQITASNVRHAYTTGVKGTSANDDTPELFGRTMFETVHDSYGYNCQSAPFSTHADGYCITFENCHAVAGYKGPSGSQQGFGIRGIGNRVLNCTCYGGTTGVSITPDYTSVSTNTNRFLVDGFVYRAFAQNTGTNTAIMINGVSTSTALEGTLRNVTITGAASAAVHFDISYATVYIENPVSKASFTGTTGHFFDIDHATIIMDGGYLDISGSAGTGITVAKMADATSSFTWKRGRMKVGAAALAAIVDFNSVAATASVTELDLDAAPSTVIGYTNGATATKQVTYRVGTGIIAGTPQRYVVLGSAGGTVRTRNSNNSTDTTQTSLTTVTLPGGSLGAHGCVRITMLGSMTNSASSKVFYIIFGGTNYLAQTGTSVSTLQNMVIIRNTGATNAQKGYASAANGYGTSSSAIVTSAVDTTADVTIDFQCKWTANVAGEAINLDHYLIEVINPSV